MIKKTLLALAATIGLFAQSYNFTVTPNQITAQVDKFGGIQTIQTPISVTNQATGIKVFQIQVGSVTDNTGAFTNSAFGTNTIFGPNSLATRSIPLNTGQTASVYITVDPSKLDISSYVVPIGILDQGTGLTVSSFVFLQVTDNRSYNLPISGSVVIPHIATGKQWVTTLQFINPAQVPSTSLVQFYDPQGRPLTVKLADGRTGSSFYTNTFGNGTNSIVVSDLSNQNTVVGTALVLPFIGPPVSVQAFYFNQNGTGSKVSSIGGSTAMTDNLSIFYDSTGGATTGFAISNSLNYDQSVLMTYFDENGNQIGFYNVTIPAMGQYLASFTLQAAVGHQGLIKVKGQQRGLSGMALRFNPDLSFVAVSVVQ